MSWDHLSGPQSTATVLALVLKGLALCKLPTQGCVNLQLHSNPADVRWMASALHAGTCASE